MTDEGKQDEGLDSEAWEGVDALLALLVVMIEREGGSFGVTLNVGGMLVCGEIVSSKTFFEGVGTEFEKALAADDPTSAAGWKRVFEEVAHGSAAVWLERETTEHSLMRVPKHIHLRNTRFWVPGTTQPLPTEGGLWWRGRLDAVLGVVFGDIKAVSERIDRR